MIMKGVIRDGKRREGVERILESIEANVEIKKIRRIEKEQREEGGKCY